MVQCIFPPLKCSSQPQDCSPNVQYLNDTSLDKMAWTCLPCPEGAVCAYQGTIDQIRARAGYWRVPWSKHNITFLRCPYLADCLGANEERTNDLAPSMNGTDNQHVHEGCVPGTMGPLCSLCIDGYNRDVDKCTLCINEAVPLRVSILLGIVVLLFVMVYQCRKKIKKKWKKYKPLYEDVLRVISINITFAQINSSVPSVIDVQWPQQWITFLKYFDFVNIGKKNCLYGPLLFLILFLPFLVFHPSHSYQMSCR